MVHSGTRPTRERIEPLAEEKGRDYSERLAELESELCAHPSRPAGTPQSALPSLSHVEAGRIGEEAVMRFVHRKKAFAVGHTDIAFPGTNGARDSLRIHFHEAA